MDELGWLVRQAFLLGGEVAGLGDEPIWLNDEAFRLSDERIWLMREAILLGREPGNLERESADLMREWPRLVSETFPLNDLVTDDGERSVLGKRRTALHDTLARELGLRQRRLGSCAPDPE